MRLPNFLGIGVQRAATTWLHNCFEEHPQIFVPASKELHFFSQNFDKGVDWYKQQFDGSNGCKAVGEITPTYLHEAPIERIAELLPDARLIIILREPIQRMVSAYRLFQDMYRNMSFEEAYNSSDYLVTRSLYSDRLWELFERYPRDRVRIFLYDDVQSNPLGVLAEVFEYLEVDSSFVPQSAMKFFNRAIFPGAQKLLTRARMKWMVDVVKSIGLADKIKRMSQSGPGNGKSVPEKFKQELKDNIFRDDLLKVQDLIDRDLSMWM